MADDLDLVEDRLAQGVLSKSEAIDLQVFQALATAAAAKYVGLQWHVQRFSPQASFDEFRPVALEAVWKSLGTWEPGGRMLRTYLWQAIKWALVDFLRTQKDPAPGKNYSFEEHVERTDWKTAHDGPGDNLDDEASPPFFEVFDFSPPWQSEARDPRWIFGRYTSFAPEIEDSLEEGYNEVGLTIFRDRMKGGSLTSVAKDHRTSRVRVATIEDRFTPYLRDKLEGKKNEIDERERMAV